MEKDTTYSLGFQVFNLSVRIAKLALDIYVLVIFSKVFSFYLKAKRQRQLGNELTQFQSRMVFFTVTVCAINMYRCVFVCVNGILSQISSIDSSNLFQGDLLVHKHLIIPFIDFLTGFGLLYLFYMLSQKNREVLEGGDVHKPKIVIKQQRKNHNTEDLIRLLDPEHVTSVLSFHSVKTTQLLYKSHLETKKEEATPEAESKSLNSNQHSYVSLSKMTKALSNKKPAPLKVVIDFKFADDNGESSDDDNRSYDEIEDKTKVISEVNKSQFRQFFLLEAALKSHAKK